MNERFQGADGPIEHVSTTFFNFIELKVASQLKIPGVQLEILTEGKSGREREEIIAVYEAEFKPRNPDDDQVSDYFLFEGMEFGSRVVRIYSTGSEAIATFWEAFDYEMRQPGRELTLESVVGHRLEIIQEMADEIGARLEIIEPVDQTLPTRIKIEEF